MKKRITWIDSLKGIAILAVVMIHSGAGSLPSFLGKIGNIGKNGVQLFFLISTFLAFQSYNKYIKKEKNIDYRTILKWFKQKIIKLIPLYYLALILSFLITGGSSFWLGREGHITVLNLLSHIFFIHGFFPHYVDSIITVEWYLSILIFIYLIIPFLHKYINNLSKAISSFIIITVACEIIKMILSRVLLFNYDVNIYNSFVYDFLFINHLPVILLGIILYYTFDRFKFDRVENKKILSYSLLFISGLLVLAEAFSLNGLLFFSDKTRFGIFFFVIIISQKIYNTKIIDNIIFNYIGRYTYSIYLFHKLIIYLYDKYFSININNHVTVSWLIKYIIVVSISLLLSIILDKFFDKPISKYINKKMQLN